MLTTILLVAASLVIGFGWGVVLTIQKFVLPLRKAHEAQLQVFSKSLDEMILAFGGPVREADGSIVSPIQIKKD